MFLRPVLLALRRAPAGSPRHLFVPAPSLVLLFTVLLATVLLALAAPQANAGTYVGVYTDPKTNAVSPYTGGNYVVPGPNGQPTSYPYALGNTQGLGSGYGGDSGGITASCTGAITASYTWQPATGKTMTNDPPPTKVIVVESCAVEVTVVSPAATGSYDTGMGQSGTVTWTPGGNNTKTATSVRYTSHAGGPTVTLPSVNASAVAASPGDTGSVRYTATLYPVFLVPTGATKDTSGNYNILVGQGCTPNLVSIPSALLNNATNPPVYAWTVTGTTFQSWVVAANQSTATLTIGPGPLNKATAHWYWNEAAATETITCQVALTPPTGQGSPFTVTVTQPVSVADPTYTCSHHEGTPFVNAAGTSLQAVGLSNTYPHGSAWVCNAQTPALFGSGGSCNFSQIITPGRSHTYATTTVACTQNGITGLDTVCPYPATGGDPYTVGSGINAGWPADNSQHQTGDSPSTGLSDSHLGTATSVSINESFSTYLMYVPPGGDVQPVGLHKLGWNWTATPSEPAGGWATANGFNTGSVTSTASARQYTQLLWTMLEGVSVGSGW